MVDVLERFSDFLSVSDIVTSSVRTLFWWLVKGLGLIVDGLESVANTMLGTKEIFNNPEVLAFMTTIRPVLWILLAISLAFTGYLLMFQRKVNAETVGVNLILAIAIMVCLTSTMNQANEFTDSAVDAIQDGGILIAYSDEDASISNTILSRNITDLMDFDANDWRTPERIESLPPSVVSKIPINEKFNTKRLTIDHKAVSEKYLTWRDGALVAEDFEQGGFTELNDAYYYRYSVDWLTIIVTLSVMAFVLFSISYKLARLSFELVFNQLLVTIIAPLDVHDGQKMKQILKNIISIFCVIIMIFLSVKLYIIGTAWLENQFEGLVYLVALIGFSVAVLDGPHIVERLFGIDAGLKNGWGILTGGVALAKGATSIAKGVSNMANGKGNIEAENGREETASGLSASKDRAYQSPLSKKVQPSPFGTPSTANYLRGISGVADAENTDYHDTTNGRDSSGGVYGSGRSSTASRSLQADQQANILDNVNGQQSVNSSSTEGDMALKTPTSPLETSLGTSPIESTPKQITSSTTASRGVQANQQVNVTDKVTTQQSVNSSSSPNGSTSSVSVPASTSKTIHQSVDGGTTNQNITVENNKNVTITEHNSPIFKPRQERYYVVDTISKEERINRIRNGRKNNSGEK